MLPGEANIKPAAKNYMHAKQYSIIYLELIGVGFLKLRAKLNRCSCNIVAVHVQSTNTGTRSIN